jgi:hypothetical protein
MDEDICSIISKYDMPKFISVPTKQKNIDVLNKYKEKYEIQDEEILISVVAGEFFSKYEIDMEDLQSDENALTDVFDQKEIVKLILSYEISYFENPRTIGLLLHVDNVRHVFKEKSWELPDWYRVKYSMYFQG